MSLNTILATAPLTTTNYILKATGTTIGNSLIFDNGTNVGIGNTNTTYKLDVSGTGNFTGALSGTSATFSSSVTIAGTNDGYGTLYVSALASTNAARLRNDNASFSTLDINNANASGTGVYSVASKNYFSGNVGIGTVTPNLAADGKALTVSAGTSGNNLIGRFEVQGSRTETDAAFGGLYGWHQANLVGRVEFQRGSADNSGNIIFGTLNAGTYGQRMTITSAGNVGIGIVPSTWNSIFVGIDFANKGGVNSYTNYLALSQNMYYGTGALDGWRYKSTGYAAAINLESSSGNIVLRNTSTSGTADAALTWQDRMTILANGNVGIGTGTPSSLLHLAATRTSGANTNVLTLSDNVSGVQTPGFGVRIQYLSNGTGVQGAIGLENGATGTNNESQISFYTQSTAGGLSKRATFTAGGDFIIGTTPTANGHNFYMESGNGAYQTIGHPNGTSTGYSYTLYYYNSGVLGGISQSGTTAVVYNTTSDYRLKEVISPIQNSIDTISKLKPILFKWKNTEDEYGEGFIAHELQEVVPLAVTGIKDAVNEDGSFKLQQVDHSKLVPHLVKAIQELSAKNEELSNRLIKLESK